MNPRRHFLHSAIALCAAPATALSAARQFDIRENGATGDGATLDTAAIQKAIDAAAAAGGGTVLFPAGRYLSFSLRLRSHVTLQLEPGSVLIAAEPGTAGQFYDAAEPNPWDMYQDFGHSHWHNSLIWGENLEDIAIVGTGRIWGRGLTRQGPGPRRPAQVGDMPSSLGNADPMNERAKAGQEYGADMVGKGNKAIALKNCRHVLLRDFSVFKGGHFALLATGVDHLTIDNVKVDTDRDGFDIDCCRYVRIANCGVNSPNDDAICLKSSYALGVPRFTENVVITNCQVSGYDLGTYFDGTFGRTQIKAPDLEGVCGRIKLGTESNGGFRNIAISNVVFERCRGLAIESVDGGIIEDIVVTNLAMRELSNSPLFIRLGRRMRAPQGTPIGAIRRVSIQHVSVAGAAHEYASIVAGLPGHPVEDVSISHLTSVHAGGGTLADAGRAIPENETTYPEPSMFGVTPAFGLYARHVRGLNLHQVAMRAVKPDARPAVVLDDVRQLRVSASAGMRDQNRAYLARGKL